MDELFQQLGDAYRQTGTDFYEDYYRDSSEGPGSTPGEQTEEFIQQLNCSAKANKPKTFKQMHPKKKPIINWRVTYFDSINNS